MRELLNSIRDQHNTIFSIFITVLCIGAIVFFIPRQRKFQYEFEEGKAWQHEDLTAPFDFALIKPQEQINLEKEKITTNSPLYFERLADQNEKSVKNFQSEIIKHWPVDDTLNLKPTLKLGTFIIDSLYHVGILENSDQLAGKNENFAIHLVNNHQDEVRELSSFLTLQKSYDLLAIYPWETFIKDTTFVLNSIVSELSPNIVLDDSLTQSILKEKIKNVSAYFGKISQGEFIISKGEIVTPEKFQILNSLRVSYEQKEGSQISNFTILIGQIFLVSTSLFTLLLYLSLYRKDIANENNKLGLIIISFSATVLMGVLPLKFNYIHEYLLPFCILPVILRTFFDARLAAFVHVLAILTTGLIIPNAYEFVFIETLTGFISVFTMINLRNRSQILITALTTFVSYCLLYVGYNIIKSGGFNSIDFNYFYWFAISSLALLASYPIILLLEKVFKIISDLTLLELSDTNNKLLSDLNNKAPGTMQHSLQVANLAEAGAIAIGGNALFVRTGALYHDIGKMNNPGFFIENQVADINPHDELTPEESATIIIEHVLDGIELAKKANLPEQIIDFIRTHHGTSQVKYFLIKAQKSNPEIDEALFTYPGPSPYSKETAILMMADSVEAASRSLKVYNKENIENLVSAIIDGQLANKQFNNADITLKDITLLKKIFTQKLQNIYHVRVEYPKG